MAAALRIIPAFGLGALGGWGAQVLGLPMPWLIGALLANAAWVMVLRPPRMALPRPVHALFVSVIGVMIGGMFTPGLLSSLAGWWPGLVGVILYTVLAQLGAFAIYHHLAGLDRATAYFAASPGGFIENINLGEEAGGDVALLGLLQFLRVVMVLIAVPFGFAWWSGQAVGSAAGVTGAPGGPVATTAGDFALLAVAALGGLTLGRVLRLPAGVLVGPVLLSAGLHLTGVLTVQPPSVAIIIAQIVIGTGLGLRFSGLSPRQLRRGVAACSLALVFYLLLAFGFAAGLSLITPYPMGTYVMSLVPAGVIEMSLVALTLGVNPVFVTTHHFIRILASVLVTPQIYARWVAKD